MKQILATLTTFLLLSTMTYAGNEDFLDISFRIKSHSMRSPEIKTIAYITPNRNLEEVSVDVEIFGAQITSNATVRPSKRTHRNLFMGETISFNLPLLISSEVHNYIRLKTISIDTKLNRNEKEFYFKITQPLNSIVDVRRIK